MWLAGVLASFVLAVWLVIMGLAHLLTRFEHSAHSRRVLGAMVIVAWVLAMVTINSWFSLSLGWSLALTFVLFLPIFTGLGVGVCELWRFRLQSTFDRQLERLEQEEAELLGRLDDIRTSVHHEALRLRESETHSRKTEDDAEKYRVVIEKWQQGEGVARIRSLRVSEWEEQYRSCSSTELMHKAEELLQVAAEARRQGDDDRAELTNVELAVVRLCASEQAEPEDAEPTSGAQRVDRLLNQQEQVNRQLEQLRGEISEWKGRKQDFLAHKIKL